MDNFVVTGGAAVGRPPNRADFEAWAISAGLAYRDHHGLWFYRNGGDGLWEAYRAGASDQRERQDHFNAVLLDMAKPAPLPHGHYVIRYNDDGEFGQATGWLYREGGEHCSVTGKPVYVWRRLASLIGDCWCRMAEEVKPSGGEQQAG
jgi:hypothetical protein